MGYVASAAMMLVNLLFTLAIVLFLLRLLLQWTRASFQNPISQFFYMATNPLLMPLARFLPSLRGFNTAAALVAWLLASLEAWLLSALRGALLNLPAGLLFGLATCIALLLWIVFFVLLLTVLISLINPGADHPIARLARQIIDPMLRPIRRRLPPLGPFDLSPLVLFIAISLGHLLLVAPLREAAAWMAMP
jgi:YggT family protein